MNSVKASLESVIKLNRDFLANIGFGLIAVFIAKKIFDCFFDIFNHFGGAFFLKKRLTGFGQWAVITGCTRGLGLEFSRQLAKLGLNLILIARNQAELEKIAKEIRTKHKVTVVSVVADLCKNGLNAEIIEQLDKKDVGILINNAGLMYEFPEYFHNVSEKVLCDIINVNVTASQMLSHYIIKKHMFPKKRGLLIFLSSSACHQLTPMMTGYSASKKYIEYMAKCLECEYADSNIFIQTLLPYYIATDMTKYSDALNKPSLLSPSAKTYVRHAIRTFGFTHETTGYLPHTVVRWCSALIPQRVWTFFAIHLMRFFRKSGQQKKVQ